MSVAQRFAILSFVIAIIVSPSGVLAAKKRVRVQKTAAPAAAGVSYSSVSLSRGTNSVIFSLKNLSGVRRVTYELSYTANGIPKGAMGTIAVSGQQTDSRDLYIGTCSKGVCTPDTGVRNVKLFTGVETAAGTRTKRYLIRW